MTEITDPTDIMLYMLMALAVVIFALQMIHLQEVRQHERALARRKAYEEARSLDAKA